MGGGGAASLASPNPPSQTSLCFSCEVHNLANMILKEVTCGLVGFSFLLVLPPPPPTQETVQDNNYGLICHDFMLSFQKVLR